MHVGVEETFVPARKAHPAFIVAADELDALAVRLEGAGLPVRWDSDLPGYRRFYTTDEHRNRVELLTRC